MNVSTLNIYWQPPESVGTTVSDQLHILRVDFGAHIDTVRFFDCECDSAFVVVEPRIVWHYLIRSFAHHNCTRPLLTAVKNGAF